VGLTAPPGSNGQRFPSRKFSCQIVVMSTERRIDTRVNAKDEVEIQVAERLVGCRLKDVSIGGAAIHLGANVEVHSDQEVVLWVEAWEPLRSKVTWISSDSCGLKFTFD